MHMPVGDTTAGSMMVTPGLLIVKLIPLRAGPALSRHPKGRAVLWGRLRYGPAHHMRNRLSTRYGGIVLKNFSPLLTCSQTINLEHHELPCSKYRFTH